MWEKLRVVFTIPELRRKILLTLVFLGIYRIGFQIPLPIINREALGGAAGQGTVEDFMEKVAVFAASNLQDATIFGLGIMPYISASIIFQLLGSVWKPLEELRKEGETGRKKINEYTRYLTVGLCFIQSWFYLMAITAPRDGVSMIAPAFLTDSADPTSLSLAWQITAVLTMTCGTIFLMWLGEQIDEFGIGNGISLLIMAGILARMPAALSDLLKNAQFELNGLSSSQIGIETLVILAFLLVAVVFGVVFITLGQRRIPTQSAKHVRGRRVYGGSRQYLPLKLNQAGVMPIIFASSLLMLPAMLFGMLAGATWMSEGVRNVFVFLRSALDGDSFTYILMYVALIYFFCYFWTAITFNPKEMSENLKDYGTFIPGYRPGRRTADYLEKVMVRIT